MQTLINNVGEAFTGLRSQYFKEIMREFPYARQEELQLALEHLQPKKEENILEIGAGSGFFSKAIAERVYPSHLVVSDPSAEQLEEIGNQRNIAIIKARADSFPLEHPLLPKSGFDAIWSGGSFHHIYNKSLAFTHFHQLLKPGGRLVISDVFSGSNLAKHFDLEVAKYCVTGHEVSFLSKEFADSLCHLGGFQKPQFYDASITWKFHKKEDVGVFLYKIHAMVHSTPEDCLKNAEQILGIEYKNGLYGLNWPLTVLISSKL